MIDPVLPHRKALLRLHRHWGGEGHRLRPVERVAVDVLAKGGRVLAHIAPKPDDHARFWAAAKVDDVAQMRGRALGLLVNGRMKPGHWSHLWQVEARSDPTAAAELFVFQAIAEGLPPDETDRPEPPDFIIIGTMKGGTSSLYNYICRHSAVQHRIPKELHFFTVHRAAADAAYGKLFAMRRRGMKIGEASPSYFDVARAEVPARIAALAPDARLFLTLAHPTKRAVSEYYHNLRIAKGAKPDEPYVDAGDILTLDKVKAAAAEGASFIGTGRYETRLPLWQDMLADGRLRIVTQRELKTNAGGVVTAAWEALGLPPEPLPLEGLPRVNANSYPAPDAEVIAYLDGLYAPTVAALQRDYGIGL